jgi:hypothetical protein
MDDMAELTAGEVPELERVRRRYANDSRWRVPGTIRSYTVEGVRTVALEGA